MLLMAIPLSVLGILFGAAIGNGVGKSLASPVRLRGYAPEEGTMLLLFRNSDYADALLEINGGEVEEQPDEDEDEADATDDVYSERRRGIRRDGRDVSADHHRARHPREPAQMLGLAAARAARAGVPPVSAEGAAAAGQLHPSGGRRAGAVRGGCGTWRVAAGRQLRWAGRMMRDFLDVPPRSLHGYRTAYPRVSKQGTDPDNGLASVEALYLAHHILGRPLEGLLDHYRWATEFPK